MKLRIHAAKAVAKRKIYETFLGPGYYIAVTTGLLFAYVLVREFIGSIDASGFNYETGPLYSLIVRALHGAFGSALLENLFAEGPFLLTVVAAYVPVLLYLSVSSIVQFSFEKKVGAVELFSYGPADGFAYSLGCLARDAVFTVVSVAIFAGFIVAAAGIGNLLVGPVAGLSLALLAFFSIAIHGYGVLSVSVTDGPFSAIILFACLLSFFGALAIGSFAIIGPYTRDVVSVLSWIFQWISPFYYWNMSVSGLYGSEPLHVAAGIVGTGLLSAAVVLLTALALRARGARP